MKKTETKTIEVDLYFSDISGKEIEEYTRHFNKCVNCGKDFSSEETGQVEEDGSLCMECTKAGFEFDYHSEPGAVGIIDKDGNSVKAPWL